MDSLLTVNKLGFAKDTNGSPTYNEKYGVFYFASEQSDTLVTYFNLKSLTEKKNVVGTLVQGDDDDLNLSHGCLSFEFKKGLVELSWTNREGRQSATFDEIELVQYMEVHWVRTLVKNRTDGYL